MGAKAKITIVDDHSIFSESLKFLLSSNKNYEVIGTFSNGVEFLSSLDNDKPDIVLIDINMPLMGGEEAIHQALKIYPDLKIIALTLEEERNIVERVLISGIKGFVSKRYSTRELTEAIEQVRNGGIYFSQDNFDMLLSAVKRPIAHELPELVHITQREKEIISLLCEGKTSKEIAELLNINHRTVETHKSKIMEKVGVKSTISLIVYAFKNNLVG